MFSPCLITIPNTTLNIFTLGTIFQLVVKINVSEFTCFIEQSNILSHSK